MTDEIPPPARAAACGALLLDFDGTLVPIAARPDAVRVPPSLIGLLRRLHARLAGALAVVTGRSMESLDRHLAPLALPAAAEHGIALRIDPAGPPVRLAALDLPAAMRAAVLDLAAHHPGTLLEHKQAGIALHFRDVPHHGAALDAAMEAIAAADPRFVVLRGKMLVELRPRDTDKGTAVNALMRAAPFAGRMPIFIGDDITDEDGIAAARALGGCGLRMAETFRTPARLAEWLEAVVEAGNEAAA